MTLLMLENKEKTFLLEQKKDQTEEINQLKEQLDRCLSFVNEIADL